MSYSFATPWTVARQAPLSMGFPRQEYWSGFPFPSPGIFLTQGSNPCLLHWQVDSLPLSHQGSPLCNRPYTKSGQDQSGFFQCSVQINNKAQHFLPCLKYLYQTAFIFTIKLQMFIVQFYNPCKSSDIN